MNNNILSVNRKRNNIYMVWLELCRHNKINIDRLGQTGCKLMHQEKLHPHFFGRNSLYDNCLCLICFSLGFFYEPNNEDLLKKNIKEEDLVKIIKLFEQRIVERIPVEYLTNEAYYSGNTFYVNKYVLVPRSLMNTRFVDFLNKVKWHNNKVLDLCAGSGCIGITLALLNPKIKVDLVDVSSEALEVAQKNINKYSLNDRVKCVQSNLFENIQEKYDLIITNPPYVAEKEYDFCPQEFKNEPEIALKSGKKGLDIITKILEQAKNHLNYNGILVAEVGCSVAKLLKKRYSKCQFTWFIFRKSFKKDSWLDKVVKFIGVLDCVFLCEANSLPVQNSTVFRIV